jgi:hypothetical protein
MSSPSPASSVSKSSRSPARNWSGSGSELLPALCLGFWSGGSSGR